MASFWSLQQAEAVVGNRRGLLRPREAVDEERVVREVEGADVEVLYSTERLHAIELVVADLAFADQITFYAKVLD